jgi:hypothetical protein
VTPPRADVPISASDDRIVIADPEDRAIAYEHLSRVAPDGRVAWSAPPPNGTGDHWIEVRVDGSEVVGRSWSGYIVRFDASTGAEIERVFTK